MRSKCKLDRVRKVFGRSSRPSPDISRIFCCDRGYARPSGRPRVSDLATYCSSTVQVQLPAVTRWHGHLQGLAATIREISGLDKSATVDYSPVSTLGWNLPCHNMSKTIKVMRASKSRQGYLERDGLSSKTISPFIPVITKAIS